MTKKQIKLEAELIEQAKLYCNNINSNPTALIRSLLTDFLKDKILTNDSIILDDPLYFNINTLLKEGSVICSSVKPTTDLDNIYIIKKVPNNLDTFENGSYYFKEPFKHKGILFNVVKPSDEKVYINYLVFDLTLKSDKTELIINKLAIKDLTVYLDVNEHKNIIKNLKEVHNKFNNCYDSLIRFKEEHKKELAEGFNNLSEELIYKLAEISYSFNKWICYNSGFFIPVKVYSELQQLIILYINLPSEDVKRLEEVLNISKEEIEVYVNSFDVSNTNFNRFYLIVAANIYSNKIESIINSYVNDPEDVFLDTMKKLFYQD